MNKVYMYNKQIRFYGYYVLVIFCILFIIMMVLPDDNSTNQNIDPICESAFISLHKETGFILSKEICKRNK